MAKNTRQITQYEIYTIRRTFVVEQGERQITQVKDIAVFDELSLAEAYKANRDANPVLDPDRGELSETLEIQNRWVETEPVAENFNVPFNP